MSSNGQHKAVLTTEVINALALRPDSVVVDATGGGGTHAIEIAKYLKKDGMLVVLDVDGDALARIEDRMRKEVTNKTTVHFSNTNFRDIEKTLGFLKVKRINGILADLGWSSEQFELSGKGFSFMRNEPLVMTLGKKEDYTFTARDILNEWSEENIADIIYGYGDERYARRIAYAICKHREVQPIETTEQLVEVITGAVPKHYLRRSIHPATRTFQALRIAVNDELGALKEFIESSVQLLAPDGRLAVISFHSLEDRIVKRAFREKEAEGVGINMTKKPIVATREEVTRNPRARSAKLRIFQKQ